MGQALGTAHNTENHMPALQAARSKGGVRKDGMAILGEVTNRPTCFWG